MTKEVRLLKAFSTFQHAVLRKNGLLNVFLVKELLFRPLCVVCTSTELESMVLFPLSVGLSCPNSKRVAVSHFLAASKKVLMPFTGHEVQ